MPSSQPAPLFPSSSPAAAGGSSGFGGGFLFGQTGKMLLLTPFQVQSNTGGRSQCSQQFVRIASVRIVIGLRGVKIFFAP